MSSVANPQNPNHIQLLNRNLLPVSEKLRDHLLNSTRRNKTEIKVSQLEESVKKFKKKKKVAFAFVHWR